MSFGRSARAISAADADGRFDPDKFRTAAAKRADQDESRSNCRKAPSPVHGGVLPAAKSRRRSRDPRVEPGMDCVSPAGHSAFSTPLESSASSPGCARFPTASRSDSSFASVTPGNSSGVCKAMSRLASIPISSWSTAWRGHRRGPARIRRPPRPADARGPGFRAQRADRDQRARAHPDRRIGQDRERLRHRPRPRAWRMVNAGARLHVRARLIQSMSSYRWMPDRVATQDPRARVRSCRGKGGAVRHYQPRCCMRSPGYGRPGSISRGNFRPEHFPPVSATESMTYAELYPALKRAKSLRPHDSAGATTGIRRGPTRFAPPRLAPCNSTMTRRIRNETLTHAGRRLGARRG